MGFAGGILALAITSFNGEFAFIMWLIVKKNRAESRTKRRVGTVCLILFEIIIGILVILSTGGLYVATALTNIFGTSLQYIQFLFFSFGFITNNTLFSVVVTYYNWNVGNAQANSGDVEMGTESDINSNYTTFEDESPDTDNLLS